MTRPSFVRSVVAGGVALGATLAVSGVALAWTGPLSSPPNCASGNPGCDAPLNVSSTGQTKSGTLYVNASGNALTANSTNGNYGGVFYGGVGLYSQGSSNIGVQGVNSGNNSWGGYFTGGYGAYGQGAGGYGVYGYSSGNIGVYGQSAANSYGVYGSATASGAVGVRGDGASNSWGGMFSGGNGLYAWNTSGYYAQLATGNWTLAGNGNISGGNLWLGYQGDWLSTILRTGTVCLGSDCRSAWPTAGYSPNQNVDNGSSPTFNDPYVNNWVRINGAGGIYWQAYGGGWNMQDATWIRSYNNKPVYMSAGFDTASASGVGCGGGLGGGYTFRVCGSANASELYTSDNLYIGYLGDWLSNRLNQAVTSGASPTFGNLYANAYYYNSDARLKQNIKPLGDTLSTVLALTPVTYEWKDASRGAGEQLGFIAQDVQKVAPDLVHTDAASGMMSVDYAKVTPLLVGAIQAQQKEIDDLKAEVEALRAAR
jgi:hypothetical protein